MISAFLISLDDTDYGMTAYGGQYGRFGEITSRGLTFQVYEANRVVPLGSTQTAVMAFPIGGFTLPSTASQRYNAYIGDDFYA